MEQFAPGTPAYDSAADVPPFRLRTPIGSMRKTMLGAFHRTLGCSVSGLSARAVLRALVFLAFGLDASGFASFRSGSTGVAFAQATKSKVAAETIKGKVSAVEVKGKTAKVTISREDGDDLDVLVTPKLAFGVEGKGTLECLRPGVVVSTDGTLSNQQLFCSEFTVHIGGVIPPAGAVQEPGDDTSWKVVGQILSGDEMGLNCNLGAGGQKRLLFETAAPTTVKVIVADVKFLAVDQEAEVTGTMRGTKFLASALKTTAEKEFTPDDLFGGNKVVKAKVPKAAANAKKTKGDVEGDAGPAGESADPFGVLKKDAKKPAAKKPAMAE